MAKISENENNFPWYSGVQRREIHKTIYPRHQNSLQADGNLSIYPFYIVPPSGGKKRLYERRSNCWFSVSHHSKWIKIKKQFNRLSPESGNTKKVDIQRLLSRFRSQQFFIWRYVWRFVWRCHAGAHLNGHQHGSQKSAETSVTEFCYKSVNLSLEELKTARIIMILYPNTRTVQIAEFSEIGHLLNHYHSSLAKCHVMQKHTNSSVGYH